MRTRLLLLSLLFGTVAVELASGRSAEDIRKNTDQSYYNQYYTAINSIVMHQLSPELAKHSDLVRPGSLQMTFRVNRAGKISNLKITSTGGNQFAQQTAVRVVGAVTLPPMPKGLIEEDPHPTMDIRIDVTIPPVKYVR